MLDDKPIINREIAKKILGLRGKVPKHLQNTFLKDMENYGIIQRLGKRKIMIMVI